MIKHTSYLRKVSSINLLNVNRLSCFVAALLCTFLVSNAGIAQSISCHGQINISLNSDCEYLVTPEVVSSATLPKGPSEFSIMLTDHYDAAIANTILDGTHLGQSIKVKLIDNATSNACWGTILVEDKMAPTITCKDTIVSCLYLDEYLPTVEDNCDSDPEIVQVGQTIELSDCTGDYVKMIKRTYQAEDQGGFRSDTCSQTIKILRIDTDNFLNPDDFIDTDDNEESNSFVCGSDYPVDIDGHPHPDTTGFPRLVIFNDSDMPIDTISLFPTINDDCKASIEYKDFVVGKDGCLTKIMREFSFADACTSFDEIYVYTQEIWIRDTEAPKLADSHPLTIIGTPIAGAPIGHGLGNSDCSFSVNIPPTSGTDNCSGIQRYEVLIDGNLVLVQNGGNVNLPAGIFELEYVGFDGCGSSDTSEVVMLEVIDNAAPVAICDRHSVIGLTLDGIVEVEAFVFDDGSFDACGIERMEISRMGDSICDSLDYEFGPSVTFCCEDVGRENMVAFRVTDFSGRDNTCMVTVEIQDKTGATVTCPSNVSIDCNQSVDLTNLEAVFGGASVDNQCPVDPVELAPIVRLDECNRGFIRRRFRVSENDQIDRCIQVIRLEPTVPFTIENLDSIVTRPGNIDTLNVCNIELEPDNLPEGFQRPIVLGGGCDLIGTSFVDERFVFDSNDANSGGACLKILRNWSVLNWCATDDDTTPEDERVLNFAQIIKVENTIAPMVTLGDNPDEICTFNDNCADGSITLTASATDDCSSNLRTLFILDAFNDGTIDDTISTSIEVTGRTTTSTMTNVFPIGTHRGIFTFIDDCNNITSVQDTFTIKNCKAPTCAFIDGLRVSLQVMDTDGDGIPDNEMACLWAEDFDRSSVSACGGELSFFFNQDQTMPDSCFSCCNVGENFVDIYVFDEFGNSSFCTTTVTVDDHNDVNFCNLTANCPTPDITVTGCGASVSPSALGEPSIGEGCNCLNLDLPFNDVQSTTTEGCQLITRTWEVNCDGVLVDNCVQRITVRNSIAPEITDCPGHITMNLGGSTACEAFVDLRQPSVSDGCNDNVTISHNSAFADMQGANASGTYPVGTTDIIFTVANECGDASTCIATITVRDNAAPICNPRDITVSLMADGEVTVGPSQVDNGSQDACSDVTVSGNNMTFDCDDAGTTQTFIYFIEDESGNRVQCSASVTVNDESLPECNTQDITVSLNNNGTIVVDPTTLQQGGTGGICGDDITLTGTDVTFDCCDAGTTRTVSYTINGTIPCSGNVTITAEDAPVCSSRDITISLDANGDANLNPRTLYDGTGGICFEVGGSTSVDFDCDDAGTTQTVTYMLISSCDDAAISCDASVTINSADGNIMISCPADVTIDCGTDISDLTAFGTATATAGCGGAAIDVTESNVSNLGVCGMGIITRTFEATDTDGATAECSQIITISGPSNPITEANITWPTSPFAVTGCGGAAPADGRPVVDTGNAECSLISISSVDSDLVLNANTACEGNVTRTWTVIDSCQLDGSGAGIFTFQQVFEFVDDVDPILTVPDDMTVEAAGDDCEAQVTVPAATATDNCDPNTTISNDSPFADTNNSGDISGIYPVGTHVVNITATDRCGNTTTQSVTITVTGSAANFSFECKKRIIQIQDNQQAVVNIDSIVCLTQVCEGAYTASFSNDDINDTVRVFTCDDVGPLIGFMSFVFLNGVLFDSCATLQVVEAQGGVCNTPFTESDISGFITTESGEGLKAAVIELEGSEYSALNTDENGYYAFPPTVNGGSYSVVPNKDGDDLNGVSTLDIIMIQKHILGLDLLDSPYKMIAADINDSKSISVADIVELRKLILGIHDELPNNTSWKAVDATYEFGDNSNPFLNTVPEEYEIFNLQTDMEVDFVGVKIGDVNESAKVVEGRSTEDRTNTNLAFEVSQFVDEVGNSVYEFSSSNYTDIEGFQFTLDISESGSFVYVKPGTLNINEDNVGLRYLTRGLVSVSYNEVEPRTSNDDEVLFSLSFESGELNSAPFVISNEITTAEAYGKDIYGVEIGFDIDRLNSTTELYQNNPNPWQGDTQIEFSLPSNMNATISIYDLSGKVLYRQQNQYQKGMNTITLAKEDLNGYNGVAYYELITKDVKLIKSMILIE